MLEYAYNDVRYLLTMGARLIDRLKKAERLPWFEESCQAARSEVLERGERPREEAWRINGWGKLSQHELVYLRALWKWRDEECRRLDRPAFKFLGNAQLMDLVYQSELGGQVEPPHYIRSGAARRLQEEVAKAREVEEKDWPEKRPERSGKRFKYDEAKFESLRYKRNRIATSLGIDGTLIASRSIMEKLTAENFNESEVSLLLDWQRNVLFED